MAPPVVVEPSWVKRFASQPVWSVETVEDRVSGAASGTEVVAAGCLVAVRGPLEDHPLALVDGVVALVERQEALVEAVMRPDDSQRTTKTAVLVAAWVEQSLLVVLLLSLGFVP